MAGFMKSDEAARNRLASMTPRDDGGPAAPAGPDPYSGRRQLREACLIRVDRIEPDPEQPRKEFDAESLRQLADSLKARGQLQPIRVRWDDGRGGYVVVLGERRWRAAKLADFESVACVVVQGNPSADELLEDQLVENALREGLKPVEQARAYQSLMGRLGLSQRELAARLNVSQGAVSQAVAMLDLPERVREAVDDGTIPRSLAYELSKVKDPAEQAELAGKMLSGGAGREEVRGRTVKSPRPKNLGSRRVDHRAPNGCTVSVTIPVGLGDADALAALQHAAKSWRKARERDTAA
jgi:ParB family transcriptional regulator, chromosome partitioning protein